MVSNSIPHPPNWKELYELAVLEVDAAKLPQRITDARKAILDSAEETFAKRGNYHECQELTDALNGLRVMQREYERREWENGQRSAAMRKMG